LSPQIANPQSATFAEGPQLCGFAICGTYSRTAHLCLREIKISKNHLLYIRASNQHKTASPLMTAVFDLPYCTLLQKNSIFLGSYLNFAILSAEKPIIVTSKKILFS
jgi:hypothetical protein